MNRFNLMNKTCVFIASSAMLLASCGGGGGADTDGGNDSLPLRSWGTAEIIEGDKGNAADPQIAIDATGNAVAVWWEIVNTGARNIWANNYTVGNGWGIHSLVENSLESSSIPDVAIDDFGNAYAVWKHFDGSAKYTIRSNIYSTSTGWGIVEFVETNNSMDVFSPQITIDSTGSALIVWRQSDGLQTNVWTNRYDNRIDRVTRQPIGWGSAQLIEASDGNVFAPTIASDDNGNSIAIWNQNNNIWVNHYVAGSGWGVAGFISNNSGNTLFPQIAINNTGNAFAVWSQDDGTTDNIWANQYTTENGWGAAELIEMEAGSAKYPHVSINAEGNAVATWQVYDQGRFNIWANNYTTNSGWGVAESVDIPSDGDSLDPQIVNDAFGNALLVWAQSDGSRYSIWANRYTSSNGWGIAEVIETEDSGDALIPKIVIDAFGDGLVVWRQMDASGINIWSNRFE